INQLQNQLAAALSSDMDLDYEDLQALINAQKEAEHISKTLLKIMNKSRNILSKDQPTQPPVKNQEIKQEKQEKRKAVKVPQGLSLESPQAMKEIFSQEDLIVLIDGYNVSLNSFQDLPLELQRERTVSCAANIESRYHPSCVIIFDGQSTTTR